VESSGLSIDKRLTLDAVKSPLKDDAMQPREGMDGYPVKVPISFPTFEIRMQIQLVLFSVYLYTILQHCHHL
jgi:hypothetical protein